MIIRYHKHFKKNLKKLDKKLRKRVYEKTALFLKNPFDEQLQNHALQGPLQGKRAIKVTGDYRIIFEEIDNYILVIMLDVGTHNQVY